MERSWESSWQPLLVFLRELGSGADHRDRGRGAGRRGRGCHRGALGVETQVRPPLPHGAAVGEEGRERSRGCCTWQHNSCFSPAGCRLHAHKVSCMRYPSAAPFSFQKAPANGGIGVQELHPEQRSLAQRGANNHRLLPPPSQGKKISTFFCFHKLLGTAEREINSTQRGRGEAWGPPTCCSWLSREGCKAETSLVVPHHRLSPWGTAPRTR